MLRPRIERRIADGLFVMLAIAAFLLAGWLAARNDRYWDWTTSARNTLSGESLAVVSGLTAPVRIEAFIARAHPLAKRIEQLLGRYRDALPDLEVAYVDPQLYPERARAANVSRPGSVLVSYRDRSELVVDTSESALTAALARLSRDRIPWIAVLEGHGERRFDGGGALDFGRFGGLLANRGYRIQPVDLSIAPVVPANTALLVISSPAIAPFPGEIDAILRYVDAGGNLLWLFEPDAAGLLDPLTRHLGLQPLPGRVVDAEVQALDIDDPTVALVAAASDQAPTRGLASAALLPGTIAFELVAAPGWDVSAPLTTTSAYSWNETGPVRGQIARDEAAGERAGPLPVALALVRPHPSDEEGVQRVLVVGDGDFLSNANLAQAGNRALGMALMQWLTLPEALGGIEAKQLGDRELHLTRPHKLVIGGGALIVMPVLLLLLGMAVRIQRMREG